VSSRISAATSKCVSIAGHFDGHAEVLKQSTWHCPMQHVQGSSGSHWTLPSGNYSFRIALAAAMATYNKTTMQNVPSLLAVSMALVTQRYYTSHIARWRRFVAFIKATKCHRRVSTRSNITNRTRPPMILGVYFIVKSLKKSSSCLNNNRGVTHQTDEKHLHNMSEFFVGVVI